MSKLHATYLIFQGDTCNVLCKFACYGIMNENCVFFYILHSDFRLAEKSYTESTEYVPSIEAWVHASGINLVILVELTAVETL
jgi:hypothetical protein